MMRSKVDIGKEIRKRLKEQKRSITWLAYEIDCDRSNLYKQLHSPHLHVELLYSICVVLREDFFAHYSQSLSENILGAG